VLSLRHVGSCVVEILPNELLTYPEPVG
jgi:hypothetical protein